MASSVLPTPVGPRNRNDPIGRFGSCSPGSASPHSVGDRANRRVLIHQPEVNLVLELQELLTLGGQHPAHRNARPLADDLGDLFGIDLFLEQPAGFLGLAVSLRFGLGNPLLERLSLGVKRRQRLKLLLIRSLAALLHVANHRPTSGCTRP